MLGQRSIKFESGFVSLGTAVSEQSSFGRRTVWVGKRCAIELKFGGIVEDSWIYLFAKFGAFWISGLRKVNRIPKGTEVMSTLLCCGSTSHGCCCDYRLVMCLVCCASLDVLEKLLYPFAHSGSCPQAWFLLLRLRMFFHVKSLCHLCMLFVFIPLLTCWLNLSSKFIAS